MSPALREVQTGSTFGKAKAIMQEEVVEEDVAGAEVLSWVKVARRERGIWWVAGGGFC